MKFYPRKVLYIKAEVHAKQNTSRYPKKCLNLRKEKMTEEEREEWNRAQAARVRLYTEDQNDHFRALLAVDWEKSMPT
jgi:hypothetical protein